MFVKTKAQLRMRVSTKVGTRTLANVIIINSIGVKIFLVILMMTLKIMKCSVVLNYILWAFRQL